MTLIDYDTIYDPEIDSNSDSEDISAFGQKLLFVDPYPYSLLNNINS